MRHTSACGRGVPQETCGALLSTRLPHIWCQCARAPRPSSLPPCRSLARSPRPPCAAGRICSTAWPAAAPPTMRLADRTLVMGSTMRRTGPRVAAAARPALAAAAAVGLWSGCCRTCAPKATRSPRPSSDRPSPRSWLHASCWRSRPQVCPHLSTPTTGVPTLKYADHRCAHTLVRRPQVCSRARERVLFVLHARVCYMSVCVFAFEWAGGKGWLGTKGRRLKACRA